MTHAYPRLEWTLCSERPSDSRRVLVLHRARPWSRFFAITIGWWNSEEWRKEDSQSWKHGLIYEPWFWRDINTLPVGFKSEVGYWIRRA